jgi:hypothetical protein
MKKRIVLCADDYGQEPEIAAAIIDLIARGRISATSCLVNFSYWACLAPQVRAWQAQADIGLHVNLSEGVPLSADYRRVYGDQFMPLATLLKAAGFKQLKYEPILAEICAQLDAFGAAVGGMPAFIDGHQHVQQFPIIRTALLAAYKRYQLKCPIRVVNPALWGGNISQMAKAAMIRLTGSGAFARALRAERIPYNPSFAGIYCFSKHAAYRELCHGFLHRLGDGGLLMCHPGLPGGTDVIAAARVAEYQYLSSDAFAADCERHNVIIHKWSTLSKLEESAII